MRSRPSVVRNIGSRLTWIKAQRPNIVYRERFNDNSLTCKENNCFKSSCNHMESVEVCEDPKYSALLETKVEELEKELINLQKQVSEILQGHKNKIFDISERGRSQDGSSDNAVSSSSSIEQRPRPPPPPPPLPPMPLIQTKLLLTKTKRTNKVITEKESVYSIMEELSKRPPKLRHVELTPGGRPVRKVLVPTDPADILTAVLKKRFEANHSPIRYLDSSQDITGSPFGY